MKKLLPALALLFLTTCVKKEIVNNEPEAQPQPPSTPVTPGANLGTDVFLFPRETYSTNGQGNPVLKLSFVTQKKYPCVNYAIAYTPFLNQNELTVRFDSIQRFSFCLTAIGPASAEIDLPANITSLVLMNGTLKDKYAVTISANAVHLVRIDTSFSHLRYEDLHRYPPQTLALVCGSNFGKEHLANDFAKILVDSAGFIPFQFTGKGLIPYPDSSSGHWVNHASKFFTYPSQAAFMKSGALLKTFKQQHLTPNDGVSIYLVTWDNQYFRSWML